MCTSVCCWGGLQTFGVLYKWPNKNGTNNWLHHLQTRNVNAGKNMCVTGSKRIVIVLVEVRHCIESALKQHISNCDCRYATTAVCKHPPLSFSHPFPPATLWRCCMRTRRWLVTGYYITPLDQKPPPFMWQLQTHWLRYTQLRRGVTGRVEGKIGQRKSEEIKFQRQYSLFSDTNCTTWACKVQM